MYMFVYQMQQLKYYYKGLLQRCVNKKMNIKKVYTYRNTTTNFDKMCFYSLQITCLLINKPHKTFHTQEYK